MQDMIPVACCGVFLLVFSTVIHYEALRMLSRALRSIRVPSRAKLLVVIFAAFVSHLTHIVLYAGGFLLLAHLLVAGEVAGTAHGSFASYIYFSAETYTSVGFGDLVPLGATRLLAGAEALNGLLLIGWSASYTYLAMERFWTVDNGVAGSTRHTRTAPADARGGSCADQAEAQSCATWSLSPLSLPRSGCGSRTRRAWEHREEGCSRRPR
jgi:hypothetical protein